MEHIRGTFDHVVDNVLGSFNAFVFKKLKLCNVTITEIVTLHNFNFIP